MSAMLLPLLAACSGGEPGPEPAASTASDDALVGGVFTYDRPEIGAIVMGGGVFCTATLIAPRAAVTAAHCVGYGAADAPGSAVGHLLLATGPSTSFTYPIDGYVSFGSGGGSRDVALLRLGETVDPYVAVPAPLADRTPADGSHELVTIFGYGCGTRPDLFGHTDPNDDRTFKKQERVFEMAPVRYGCPGDSGGPTAIGTAGDGAIFRVSSTIHYFEIFGFGLPDDYGDLVALRGAIDGQIQAWGAL